MAEAKQEEKPAFRLIYYPFSGRGESIRLTAVLGGVAFEEDFLTIEQSAKEKAEGKRRWSGPPEIVIYDSDGKEVTKIGQSNTILRYVGKLGGLYPKDDVQAALVDEVLDSMEDIFSIFFGIFFAPEDVKDDKAKEYCKEGGKLRYFLDKFALRIKENADKGNKNGLIVGDSLTIADLKVASLLGFVKDNTPGGYANDKDGTFSDDKYKSICNLIEYVKGQEKVKAYNQVFATNTESYKKDPKVTKYSVKKF